MDAIQLQARKLVCREGQPFYPHNGQQYPCDSLWLRVEDAAIALVEEPAFIRLHLKEGGIPSFDGILISFDWVQGIAEARRRFNPEMDR